MQANRIILNNEHQYKFVEVCCALFYYSGVVLNWRMLGLSATYNCFSITTVRDLLYYIMFQFPYK